MPKIETTITYTFQEIKQILESHLSEGQTLKLIRLNISEKGDYDKGDYKQTLDSIEFELNG
jgi:hypothetical protein